MSTQRVSRARDTRVLARMHSERETVMTEQSVSSDAQPATPATVIEAGEKLTPAAAARAINASTKRSNTKRSNTKRATKPAQRDKPAQRTQRTQRDKPAQRDDSMSESQLKR